VIVFEEEGEEEEDVGPPPEPGEEDTGPGVVDVHSGSGLTALNGTPYASGSSGERGYNLVALSMIIAVTVILVAAAARSGARRIQRDREES